MTAARSRCNAAGEPIMGYDRVCSRAPRRRVHRSRNGALGG